MFPIQFPSFIELVKTMTDLHHYFHFATPSDFIARPSGASKTAFVVFLLKEAKLMVQPPPGNISLYYSESQPWFEGFNSSIKFIKGSPKNIAMSPENNTLIVIDYLFHDTNKYTVQLFAASSHHRNISIIFITKNVFHLGPHQQNISLNADYVVFFFKST